MEPVQPPVMVGCYCKISKNPKKRKFGRGELYSGGVNNLLLYKQDKLIVGTGDGTVEMVTIVDLPRKADQRLRSPSNPQIKTVQRYF